MIGACTHESHAAAKERFAESRELVYNSLQFWDDELAFVFVDCTLCRSTLAVAPDVYTAATVRRADLPALPAFELVREAA